jgi:hypothetical protein
MPTVTPVADNNGNIVDFSVSNGNEGAWKQAADSFVEFQDGSIHHQFENVEINEDEAEQYSVDDYWNDVISLDPDIPQAIQWASSHLAEEFIADFNAALDADNRDEVNEYLEMILNDYREASESGYEESEEYESEDSDEEPVEYTEEDVQDVVDSLSQQEALGEEYADAWQQAVYAYQDAGDEVGAAIAASVSAFHAGEVTAEDAINYVLQNYDMDAVARVYQALNG